MDEGGAPVERRLEKLEPEQALDEPGLGTGLDPTTPQRLGHAVVVGQQAGADRVEHVVDDP